MDNFSAALQHLRDAHDKEIKALLSQVDELRGRCLAKETEVERLMKECEKKDGILQEFTEKKEQQLVELKQKLLQRNKTILTLRGMRPNCVDRIGSSANNTTHTGSHLLIASSTPSQPTTEQTKAPTVSLTKDSSAMGNDTAVMSSQGISAPADVDDEKAKTEEEVPALHYERSISSVEAYSPSLLDSSTSETRSLISPQLQEDEEGMSVAVFSPSLLNCKERLPCHSAQMELTNEVTSCHNASTNSTNTSDTDHGSSALPLGASPTRLVLSSGESPPALGIPPSDTQYLMQSINTFPMSPEIGMGSRKNVCISLDEDKGSQCAVGSRSKTGTCKSTDMEGTVMRVNRWSTDSTSANNRTYVEVLSKAEHTSGRKRLALQKGKQTRIPKQRTLTQTFLKVSPELWREESIVRGSEDTAGKGKCVGEEVLSGTLASSLTAWNMAAEEDPSPRNATPPKKTQPIPRTTSSPIAPKFKKVVTVVPQTPLLNTSPSSASRVSPRGWGQRWKNRRRHPLVTGWDPEETYLPPSQLDYSGSRKPAGEEVPSGDTNSRVEQGKPHASSATVGQEQFKLSIHRSSASDVLTGSNSVTEGMQQTVAQTCASKTAGATDGAQVRRRRTCDEDDFNSNVIDASLPPAKRHAFEAQEGADHSSSSPSKDAVIRRLGLPTGFKCNVPVRRQEDRRQLDARACHQCELWYRDNPGRMKQSCRHKELHQRSDTPADFFRVDFTPTQEDSQHT